MRYVPVCSTLTLSRVTVFVLIESQIYDFVPPGTRLADREGSLSVSQAELRFVTLSDFAIRNSVRKNMNEANSVSQHQCGEVSVVASQVPAVPQVPNIRRIGKSERAPLDRDRRGKGVEIE